MYSNYFRRALMAGILASSATFSNALIVQAQENARGNAMSNAESSAPGVDSKALADVVGALQAEVQALRTELGDLRRNQERAASETAVLRTELNATKAELAARLGEPGNARETYRQTATLPITNGVGTAQGGQEDSVEQRITKLEDNQQLADTRLAEQNQTKVESGSKYRLRLSGIVLLNGSYSHGTVDNLDFPQLAVARDPLESSSALGGSLRQSQIGLEVFGPEIGGARTSANLKLDFAGGSTEVPNGATLGLMRLRTGTIRFDWENTSIIAGQDSLFFAPLTPTSLAALAVPALSYAGNLWSWTPQIRVEHRIVLSDASTISLQGGILDGQTGDVPQQPYRYPSAGEQSGQPAYASRVAWHYRGYGREFIIGAGGYYSRENWGPQRRVDSWAGMTDVTVPLSAQFTLTGEFYRGRALGGLGGGIGQTILLSGNYSDPTTVIRGMDSEGGWLQLKFKPKTKFEVNAAIGQDNPFAGELRRFPGTAQYYGASWSRNFSPLFNFIYQVRSDVLFSVEYRRLQTYTLDSAPDKANQTTLSLGYLF